MGARLAGCSGDTFKAIFVDVRGGEGRVCVLAVPRPEHAKLSELELLAVPEKQLSVVPDLKSHGVPKGLIRVTEAERAQWSEFGMTTPLGKFIRGKIANHYAHKLDALYAFMIKFREKCLALVRGSDLTDKLVGLIPLLVEAEPGIVRQHSGHLSSLGVSSLGLAKLSSALIEPQFNSRQVSAAAVAGMSIDGLVQYNHTQRWLA